MGWLLLAAAKRMRPQLLRRCPLPQHMPSIICSTVCTFMHPCKVTNDFKL